MKSIAKDGIDATLAEIESTLPRLSKIGSQDDMSIAMIFDAEKVAATIPQLIEWQISNVKKLIADESAKLKKAQDIQQSFESAEAMTQQEMIALQYANTDETRAIEMLTKLQGQLDALEKERSDVNII